MGKLKNKIFDANFVNVKFSLKIATMTPMSNHINDFKSLIRHLT
jgi:hypothetical protein